MIFQPFSTVYLAGYSSWGISDIDAASTLYGKINIVNLGIYIAASNRIVTLVVNYFVAVDKSIKAIRDEEREAVIV